MAQCLKSFIPKYNVKNVRYKTDIKAHLAIRLSASKKTFAYKLSAVFAILSYIMCFEMIIFVLFFRTKPFHLSPLTFSIRH